MGRGQIRSCRSRLGAITRLLTFGVLVSIIAGHPAAAFGVTVTDYVHGAVLYMWGDTAYERTGTYPYAAFRGVAANIWTYGPSSFGGAWWATGVNRGRLCSIYVHEPSGFGRHVEIGIERFTGYPPKIFVAYSNDPSGEQQFSYVLPGSPTPDAYTYFELNNFTNDGATPEEWRLAYGGILIDKAYLNMVSGQARMSTEVTDCYQDKRSQFHALQRKNPNGTWGWAQNVGQNPYYIDLPDVSWYSYSPTHWYTWPTN